MGRGLCNPHYRRLRRHGDPLTLRPSQWESIEQRFWSKVDKNGPIPDYDPKLGKCWIWTAGKSLGYGFFNSRFTQVRAHRVSYEWLVGPIPDGLVIDHLCHVKECVNPSHLDAVTLAENTRRRRSPNSAKAQCPHGHEYNEENTHWTENGWRLCRTCARIGMQRKRARMKLDAG